MPLLTEKQAAQVLALSIHTLQKLRRTGSPIPFVRVTKKAIRYRSEDIEAYILSQQFRSTSDYEGKNAR